MKSTVMVYKRSNGYLLDTHCPVGKEFNRQGLRAGLDAYEAAVSAARALVQQLDLNPEGAALMAPPEVLAQMPEHLRAHATNGAGGLDA